MVKPLPELAKDVRLFAKYHLVRRSVTYPAPETELGHHRLDYDPEAYAAQLRDLDATVREEASLTYRGRTHPIHLVQTPPAARHLLVLAGVHGNEHAGILAVPEAVKAHLAERAGRVQLSVLTPVNPVGAAQNSRYNADGYDINRDFVRFYTEEARVVSKTIRALRPDFVLSLHEGPQEATFLFANRKVTRSAASTVLERLSAAGVELAAIDYFGRTLPTPGYAPMSPTAWRLSMVWAKALGMMTTGVFADGEGIPEITLETPWQSDDRDARVRAHVAATAAVAEHLEGAG